MLVAGLRGNDEAPYAGDDAGKDVADDNDGDQVAQGIEVKVPVVPIEAEYCPRFQGFYHEHRINGKGNDPLDGKNDARGADIPFLREIEEELDYVDKARYHGKHREPPVERRQGMVKG